MATKYISVTHRGPYKTEVTIESNGNWREYYPTKSSKVRLQRALRRREETIMHFDEQFIRVAGFYK